jgi:hypothetical protein
VSIFKNQFLVRIGIGLLREESFVEVDENLGLRKVWERPDTDRIEVPFG